MTRSLYGIHERCPIDVMPDGWVLYIAEVGDGSDPHPGIDLRDETRARMIRIQWLFGEHGGCYPPISRWAGFLQRVESLAANTPDCHVWIAGNEPNLSIEGLHTPEYTADMYSVIRLAVRMQAGHEDDVVLLPPIGPWNVETGIGWIDYFVRVIDLCLGIDGFALHTYSRGADPSSITSEAKMGAPYEHLYSGFRTYRDWLAAIPARFRDRPVYITETNQNDAWLNENNGWVQAAYKEIDDWNHTPGVQQIRAMIIYRWPRFDKYYIEGKSGVIEDFKAAQERGYTVPGEEQPPTMPEWKTIYLNDCEIYYDQDGQPELTIPLGSALHWRQRTRDMPESQYKRPEMDHKKTSDGQSEVHNPPGASATGFYISSTGEFAWVFDSVRVTPGDRLRAKSAHMHIAHEGGQRGAVGGRIGIVLGDSPFDSGQTEWPVDGPNPFESDSIAWGPDWLTSYKNNPDYLPDRQWAWLETGEIPHGVSKARVIVYFTSNNSQTVHAFMDDVSLEMYTEGDSGQPPPGNGECDLSKLYAAKAREADILSEAYGRVRGIWEALIS